MKKNLVFIALCLLSLAAAGQKKVSVLGDSYSTFIEKQNGHPSIKVMQTICNQLQEAIK